MLSFSCPVLFLLLPLPLLIWWTLPCVAPKISSSLKVPFFTDLHDLTVRTQYRFDRLMACLLVITSLLVTALAGPRWIGSALPLVRTGASIMLVLDISPSMEVRDMQVHGQRISRLAVVKSTAAQFLDTRSGDQFGLIVFGEKAYLLTPLTGDKTHVLHQLNDMTSGLAGPSTSIGDALGLAIKRLSGVPAHSRIIILLTDGVSNSGVLSPLKAADLAGAAGICVYTIGLGADVDSHAVSGMFLSLNGVTADLDEATLKAVAARTGGKYFRATDFSSLKQIYSIINKLAKTPHENSLIVRSQYDLYPWPLALAIWLLFVFFIYLRKQR